MATAIDTKAFTIPAHAEAIYYSGDCLKELGRETLGQDLELPALLRRLEGPSRSPGVRATVCGRGTHSVTIDVRHNSELVTVVVVAW